MLKTEFLECMPNIMKMAELLPDNAKIVAIYCYNGPEPKVKVSGNFDFRKFMDSKGISVQREIHLDRKDWFDLTASFMVVILKKSVFSKDVGYMEESRLCGLS